ncbi:MAG: hypothetical protein ABFD89_00730 [Bryobacteraceae bacterium]
MHADLHEQLSDYVHTEKKRRKASIDDEIQRAIRMMLSAIKGHRPQLAPVAKADQGYPYPETREWHEKLERVLTEGTKRNRIGIEENLDWAVGNLGKSADEELLIGKRTVNEKR